ETPSVEAHAVACPDFVPFVERGITSGRQILGVAEAYLAPLQAAGVDTLVLGCTHYPLLTGIIQLAMGDNVTLVSSAEETAKDVLRILTERDELTHVDNQHTRLFESIGDPETFARLAQRFLGPQLSSFYHREYPNIGLYIVSLDVQWHVIKDFLPNS